MLMLKCLFAEGPTHSSMEQNEIMDVDTGGEASRQVFRGGGVEQYEVMGVATHFEVSTVSPEGPTHSGVEQYEVMDVDEESAGADGPGPQRCESTWPSSGQCQSVCPSVFSPCCELGFRMLFTHMFMSGCFHVH